MKKKLSVILLCFAAICLTGCNLELMPGDKKGPELVFRTTTEMEEGDLVGIFIDRPVLFRNVKATHSAGALTTNSTLYWPADMPDSLINFRAYAPYDEAYNNVGVVSFTARLDQSEDAEFKASDLLYGVTMASPAAKKISFDFDHHMSKLVLYVQSVVDAPIDEVVLNSVYPSIYTNFETGMIKCTGDKMDIKGHLSSVSEDGVCAYEFIVAPQKNVVSFTIKAGDTVCSATTGETVSLENNMQYAAKKLIQVSDKRKRPYTIEVEEQKWSQPDFVYEIPAAGTDFSELSEYGIYKVSDGMAEEAFSTVELSCQTAVFYSTKNFGFKAFDLSAGQYFMVNCTSATVPSEGNSVSATINTVGIDGLPAELKSSLEVYKKDGKTLWLLDEANELGFIIMTK